MKEILWVPELLLIYSSFSLIVTKSLPSFHSAETLREKDVVSKVADEEETDDMRRGAADCERSST